MSSLKIIIIARTIFPSQSPRPVRTTELAKELARKGHDVTVYALLGNFDYTAFTKTTGVKVGSLGYSKFGNGNSDDGKKRKTLLDKILYRLFGRIFAYPEIELVFKVFSVLRNVQKFDYLVTIAAPFSIHWGAALYRTVYKSKSFTAWTSDCGDPFMGNPFAKHPFYFKYIEKWWLQKTDFVSIPIENARKAYYQEYHRKISIIPQGFNFSGIDIDVYKPNKIPHFCYSGVAYKHHRDPTSFLKFLTTLDIDFKFIVYTKTKNFFTEYSDILGEKLSIRDYVPRADLLKELAKMDFLVNIRNESDVQSPSKLIDYALSARPILEISSDFQEVEIFHQFIAHDYRMSKHVADIEQYAISNVADKFVSLHQVISESQSSLNQLQINNKYGHKS